MARPGLVFMVLFCLSCSGPRHDDQGRFRQAAVAGDLVAVKQSLSKSIEINGLDEANRTALFDAVINDYPEITQVLIQHGAKVNLKDVAGKTPLQWAENPKMKKILIDAGAN